MIASSLTIYPPVAHRIYKIVHSVGICAVKGWQVEGEISKPHQEESDWLTDAVQQKVSIIDFLFVFIFGHRG